MDLADQPDPRRAMAQWVGLVVDDRAARRHRRGRPAACRRARHGLRDEPRSRPRPPRRRPTSCCPTCGTPSAGWRRRSAQPWFERSGRSTSYVGRDGVGAHLEAGDVFAWGDALVAGYGPRTEELALKHLATDLGVRVRGVRITHPAMYHLDLAFCPLDDRRAMVAPGRLRRRLGVGPAGARARAAGAHRRGGADDVLRELDRDRPHRRDAGRRPGAGRRRSSPTGASTSSRSTSSEFHKGGGSVRCLTNPVDVTLGRDVPLVAGGEVVAAPAERVVGLVDGERTGAAGAHPDGCRRLALR